MSLFVVVLCSILFAVVNSETNLMIRRKRNAVIPIAQAENKITQSSFWDKEQSQDFTSDHRFDFDRFLQDIASMSMTTGTPVRPNPSPMAPVPTVTSATPVTPVSAPTLPSIVNPDPSAPSSASAPTSAPVTSTTAAPVAGTITSAPSPVTGTTASPVSSNLTTSAPVLSTTVAPSNRTSTPTLAPTLTPDSASATPVVVSNGNCDFILRDSALLDVLLTVSNSSQIEDESTPQGAAYRWMNTTNTTGTDLCGDPARSLSLYGLLVLYFSTEGIAWTNNIGWLVTSDYCQWYGITCNADGDVIEIALGKHIFCWSVSAYEYELTIHSRFNRFEQSSKHSSKRIGGD